MPDAIALPASPVVVDTSAPPSIHSPADTGSRRVALGFAVALVFLRFSMLHQVVPYLLGFNVYLLYIIGIPAILGVLACGGIRRTLAHRPAWYWVLFTAWLFVVTPFSTWRGGSAQLVFAYLKNEVIILFVIAGLVTTWRECRWMLGAIAAGGFVNLASSRLFDKEDSSGRFSLSIGTVANANDFAGHLLLVLPFLVWLAITPRTRFIRLLALTGVAYGMYLVLASGSRGATIALAVDLVFFIFAARPRQRVAVLLLGLAFVAAAVTVLPDTVVRRITALSTKDSDAPEEAVESSRSRQMLLEDSISMALHHPFFGVGPGQFAIIEGQSTRRWHPAHNSYTATAAETGLVGFGLFLAGVLATWRMLKRAARNAAGVSLPSDYTAALLCARLAMVGFCTAIFFLNFSYFFYLPALTGLAITLSIPPEPEAQVSQ